MVKRLILAMLFAASGAGAYVWGSASKATKPEVCESAAPVLEEPSDNGWHVEYVDAEGNPIQRDTGLRAATDRLKLTSQPFLKRLSGSTTPTIHVTGDKISDCEKLSSKPTGG